MKPRNMSTEEMKAAKDQEKVDKAAEKKRKTDEARARNKAKKDAIKHMNAGDGSDDAPSPAPEDLEGDAPIIGAKGKRKGAGGAGRRTKKSDAQDASVDHVDDGSPAPAKETTKTTEEYWTVERLEAELEAELAKEAAELDAPVVATSSRKRGREDENGGDINNDQPLTKKTRQEASAEFKAPVVATSSRKRGRDEENGDDKPSTKKVRKEAPVPAVPASIAHPTGNTQSSGNVSATSMPAPSTGKRKHTADEGAAFISSVPRPKKAPRITKAAPTPKTAPTPATTVPTSVEDYSLRSVQWTGSSRHETSKWCPPGPIKTSAPPVGTIAHLNTTIGKPYTAWRWAFKPKPRARQPTRR